MITTELMIRLIKNKETVGYHLFKPWNPPDGAEGCMEFDADMNVVKDFDKILSNHFDSFELGKKEGDKWLFSGDIVKYTRVNPAQKMKCENNNIGKLDYDAQWGLFVVAIPLMGSFAPIPCNEISNMECIGNIHDNPELLKNE